MQIRQDDNWVVDEDPVSALQIHFFPDSAVPVVNSLVPACAEDPRQGQFQGAGEGSLPTPVLVLFPPPKNPARGCQAPGDTIRSCCTALST